MPETGTSRLYQLLRYGIVGITSNILGYLLYLLITWLGVNPKLVVSLFYPIGALIAFYGHAKFAFRHMGSKSLAFLRYFTAHIIGYSINVFMLVILSDKYGLPHQAVQAAAIIVVAGVLFILFRYFVFKTTEYRAQNDDLPKM